MHSPQQAGSRNLCPILQKSSSLNLLTGESEYGRMSTATYCLDITGSGKPRAVLPSALALQPFPKPPVRDKIQDPVNRIERVADLSIATVDTTVRPQRRELWKSTVFSPAKAPAAVLVQPRYVMRTSISQKYNANSGSLVLIKSPSGADPRMFRLRKCSNCNENVIRESADESMLHEYWARKDEVEEKYGRLLAELDSEEKTEITHYALREPQNGQSVCDRVLEVRHDYERTRELLLKQKIVELEEILAEYKSKIV